MKRISTAFFVSLAVILMLFVPQQGESHPTWTGEQGLFGVSTAESLGRGDFSFGFYLNNWDRELGESKDSMDLDITAASFSLYYGVLSKLEIGFHVQYLDLQTREEGEFGTFNGISYSNNIEERGMGDVTLGLKYTILDPREYVIGVGLATNVKIPTADEEKGLGTGETDFGFRVIVSKLFESVGVHANTGYSIIGEPDGQSWDNVLDYGVGLVFPVDAPDKNFLQFITELKGANAPDPELPDYLDLTMGIRYHFNQLGPKQTTSVRNGWALSAAIRYNLMMEFDDCPLGGLIGISFTPLATPPPPPPKPEQLSILGLECAQEAVAGCEAINLSVKVSAPGSKKLDYIWTATCGTIVGNGPTVSWEAPCPCPSPGKMVCVATVEVRDENGKTDSATCSINVVCPSTPPAEVLVPPTFKEIMFARGSARVDNIAKAILDEIALRLKNDPRLYVIINGYTEDMGNETKNMQLGLQRANNVKEYLVKQHGIASTRLETLSFGSSLPTTGTKTTIKSNNDRVEFLVEYR